eukprot:scaffold1272_cov250-Pinguiococcus_pyrenoidosus.AAC.2
MRSSKVSSVKATGEGESAEASSFSPRLRSFIRDASASAMADSLASKSSDSRASSVLSPSKVGEASDRVGRFLVPRLVLRGARITFRNGRRPLLPPPDPVGTVFDAGQHARPRGHVLVGQQAEHGAVEDLVKALPRDQSGCMRRSNLFRRLAQRVRGFSAGLGALLWSMQGRGRFLIAGTRIVLRLRSGQGWVVHCALPKLNKRRLEVQASPSSCVHLHWLPDLLGGFVEQDFAEALLQLLRQGNLGQLVLALPSQEGFLPLPLLLLREASLSVFGAAAEPVFKLDTLAFHISFGDAVSELVEQKPGHEGRILL